jgi:hypothetical protein
MLFSRCCVEHCLWPVRALPGVFETVSHLTIEARDRFSNRVYEGPRNEVILLHVASATGGSFTVSSCPAPLLCCLGLHPLPLCCLRVASGVHLVKLPFPRLAFFLLVGCACVCVVLLTMQLLVHDKTVTIPFNASPDAIAEAIQATGEVGGIAASAAFGVVKLELTTDVGDVPDLLEIGSLDLLMGTGRSVTIKQCNYGRQQIITASVEAGGTLGGTFRVVFNGETTLDMPHNVDAAAFEAQLMALPSITLVSVTQSSTPNGQAWVVDMTAVNVPEGGSIWLFPEGDLLTGAAARIVIGETCPSIVVGANVVGSESGRTGQDWVGRLHGAAEVKALIAHAGNGLYAGRCAGELSPVWAVCCCLLSACNGILCRWTVNVICVLALPSLLQLRHAPCWLLRT